MTAPNTAWTVYTVKQNDDTFTILKTRWTQDGPQDTRIARTLEPGTTAEDAEKRAQQMQASYDQVRNAVAP